MTFFKDFQKENDQVQKKPSSKLRQLDQQGAFENEIINPVNFMNPMHVEHDGFFQPSYINSNSLVPT